MVDYTRKNSFPGYDNEAIIKIYKEDSELLANALIGVGLKNKSLLPEQLNRYTGLRDHLRGISSEALEKIIKDLKKEIAEQEVKR